MATRPRVKVNLSIYDVRLMLSLIKDHGLNWDSADNVRLLEELYLAREALEELEYRDELIKE